MKFRFRVGSEVAKNEYCAAIFEGQRIGFRTPVDLEVDDLVGMETDDGQPFVIFRPGVGVIWSHDTDERIVSGEVTIKMIAIDREALDTLWAALGKVNE